MDDSEGFEILLRPVRDVIVVNWGKTLKVYLNKYLAHLNDITRTNFSEAALVLQNSTKFYNRRVDILYDVFSNFTLAVNDNSHGQNPLNPKLKGKRFPSNNFYDNDLVKLGPISPASYKNLQLEDITNEVKTKRVVLNPLAKVPLKTGTACPIFHLDETELGHQDEFRLFWQISSDVVLTEDFSKYGNTMIRICSDQQNFRVDEGDDDNSGNSYCMDDNICDSSERDMDLCEPEPPSINQPLIESIPTPVINDKPSPNVRNCHQRRENNDKIKKKVIIEWKTISFGVKIPFRKIRKKCQPQLSDELQEINGVNKTNKRKRNSDTNVYKCLLNDLFYQKVLIPKSLDALGDKYDLIQLKRHSILKRGRGKKNIEILGDIDDFNNNHDDNGFQEKDDVFDFVHDDDDDEVHTTNAVIIPLEFNGLLDDNENCNHNKVIHNSYDEMAINCRKEFRSQKKIFASRATEIAERVSEWHKSILPAIEAAEARSAFDVHEYGTKIINKFNDNENRISFDKIINDIPKEEVANTFLATLMLANTYNVEICKSNNDELAIDCLELRLLSKVRHQDVLNENIGATAAAEHR